METLAVDSSISDIESTKNQDKICLPPPDRSVDLLMERMVRPALCGEWNQESYNDCLQRLADTVVCGPQGKENLWKADFWLEQLNTPVESLTHSIRRYVEFREKAMKLMKNPLLSDQNVPVQLFSGIELLHQEVMDRWEKLRYVLECVENEWELCAKK